MHSLWFSSDLLPRATKARFYGLVECALIAINWLVVRVTDVMDVKDAAPSKCRLSKPSESP